MDIDRNFFADEDNSELLMKLPLLFERFKSGGLGRKPRILQPPKLECAVRIPYGPFQFKVSLEGEFAYEIEATTNLKNWETILCGSAIDKTDFLDSQASKFSYRFYRLKTGQVYSANIIGYVTVTLPPAFSMIANPLKSEDTRVMALFKGMPDHTKLSKFDAQSHRLGENSVEHRKWSDPIETLMPGEGALIFNPTSDYKSVSFVGDVMQGEILVPIPAGFSIRSSTLPLPGRLDTDLAFPIGDGDVVHLFDRDKQAYVLYPFEHGGWIAGPPVIGAGESFWVAKKSGGNWVTNYRPPETRTEHTVLKSDNKN